MSTASRHLSHYLSLAINSVIFTAVFVVTFRQAARRHSSADKLWVRRWHKHGPSCLVAVGATCILADNFRHVAQDLGVWPPGDWPGSSQYRANCEVRWVSNTKRHCERSEDCGPFECGSGSFSAAAGLDCYTCRESGQYAFLCTTGAETFSCLSAVGWVFTIFLTYSGFFLLASGAAWNSNLCSKLSSVRHKWHELREISRSKSGPPPASASSGA